MTLEICTASIDSVLAAIKGGAQRVELCSALSEGGITPSYGLIQAVTNLKAIKVNVLIRPRGGDFLYSKEEVDIMTNDIETAGKLGCNGVVIGALTKEGDIDIETCKKLIDTAKVYNMEVTFHRAFDLCKNPLQALEIIISLGCDRILTSGQASTAYEGMELIKEFVDNAKGRICIMPGSGVNSKNAFEIINNTGAKEIHASAKKLITSKMVFHLTGVNMGTEKDEYSRMETDAEEVKNILSAINKQVNK